jgi:hypothetical protein
VGEWEGSDIPALANMLAQHPQALVEHFVVSDLTALVTPDLLPHELERALADLLQASRYLYVAIPEQGAMSPSQRAFWSYWESWSRLFDNVADASGSFLLYRRVEGCVSFILIILISFYTGVEGHVVKDVPSYGVHWRRLSYARVARPLELDVCQTLASTFGPSKLLL